MISETLKFVQPQAHAKAIGKSKRLLFFYALCSCENRERIMANKVSGKTMNLTMLLLSCVTKLVANMLHHTCVLDLSEQSCNKFDNAFGRIVPNLFQQQTCFNNMERAVRTHLDSFQNKLVLTTCLQTCLQLARFCVCVFETCFNISEA